MCGLIDVLDQEFFHPTYSILHIFGDACPSTINHPKLYKSECRFLTYQSARHVVARCSCPLETTGNNKCIVKCSCVQSALETAKLHLFVRFQKAGCFDCKMSSNKIHQRDDKRLIIILENAQLESVKIGNSYELLNCDDHASILKKNNRDLGSSRPDITHQCLLMLMDSPLNRAGLLQVYIKTEKNVLIEINPQTRIPRTFKRFAGLMVQLLHKFSVRASDGPVRLLKVIKNPVTDHLPVGCKKIAMSFSANKVVHPRELVPNDEPIAIVVGAMPHGQVKADYTEATYSISNYPLSAAITCGKLCSAFEETWGVV